MREIEFHFRIKTTSKLLTINFKVGVVGADEQNEKL